MKKNILIIYTGGTIGCLKNNQGNLSPVDIEILKNKFLQKYENYDFISTKNIIDSSHLNINDLIEISNIVQNSIHQKIVILHGTDTMCYTAAWLCYFFNTKKSIALTGSMKTFEDLETDCYSNLDFAISVVTKNKVGVKICFDNFELNPHYTEKINTQSNAGSFVSIVDSNHIQSVFGNNEYNPDNINCKHFNWGKYKQKNKSILHINLNPFLPNICTKNYAAIALSIYGNGTIDTQNKTIKQILNGQNNIYINTQTIGGIIDFKYQSGIELKNYKNIKLISSITTPSLICFAHIYENYIFEN